MELDDSGLQVDQGETSAPGESSTSAASSPTLTPTERRARDRASEAIRQKASEGPFGLDLLLHSAMRVHATRGNQSAKKIHQKLMDDPNSMDDYFQPVARTKKLSLPGACSLLVNHVSKSF